MDERDYPYENYRYYNDYYRDERRRDDRDRYREDRSRGFFDRAGDESAERRWLDEREGRGDRGRDYRQPDYGYYGRDDDRAYRGADYDRGYEGRDVGRRDYGRYDRGDYRGDVDASRYGREDRSFRGDYDRASYGREDDRGSYGRSRYGEPGGTDDDYGWTYTEAWFIPGPHTGRGPEGYQRSDDRIHEDACQRLTQHGRVDASDISVKVDHGEITLEGTVGDRRTKRMAEDAVEDISGVRDVHNRIRVQRENEQGQQSQGQQS